MPTQSELIDVLDGAKGALFLDYDSRFMSVGQAMKVSSWPAGTPLRGHVITCITGTAYIQLGAGTYSGVVQAAGGFAVPSPEPNVPFDVSQNIRTQANSFTYKITEGQTVSIPNYIGEIWGSIGTSSSVFRVTVLLS
jgi:hypothetical protein